MIFNIIFFIMASVYWYYTGHAVPAFIGIIMLFMYTEKLAFSALLTAGAAIFSIIYFFFSDFFTSEAGEVLEHTTGIIYILVIWLKARRIFYNDEFGLD